ncbi:MAG TPA: RHS repeat-associated core domain-containing protein [Verrucomicrobiae bacterium]
MRFVAASANGTISSCSPVHYCGARITAVGHSGTGNSGWDPPGADAAAHGCSVEISDICPAADGVGYVYWVTVSAIPGAKLKTGSFDLTCWVSYSCTTCGTDTARSSITITVQGDEDQTDPHEGGGCGGRCGPALRPAPGSGSVKNNDLDFRLYLGAAQRDDHGNYDDAGYLALQAARASSALASPAALTLPYSRPGVTRIPSDPNQQLRQIKMPQGLVHVTNVVSGEGYTLKVYDKTQVGDQQPDGTYALVQNATPAVSWAVTWNGTQNTVTLSETPHNGTTRNYTYSYSVSGNLNTWTLIRPDQSYSTCTTNTTAGGYVRTFELHNSDGGLVRTNQRTYKIVTSTGDYLLTNNIEGDASANQVTAFDYYPDNATASANRLRRVDYPDGNWVYYEYDDQGRKRFEYAAYNNSALPANTAPVPASIGCKETEYTYNDTLAPTPSSTVVRLPWPAGNNTWVLCDVAQRDETPGGIAQPGVVGQYAVPGGTPLVTTTEYITAPTNSNAGAIKSVTYPDGHAEYFSYGVPDTNDCVTTTNFVGEPGVNGAILSGTQTETKRDNLGRTVSIITRAVTNGTVGIVLSSRSFQYSDTVQDYSETDELTDQTTSYTFDCCGLATMTDPDGVVTHYDNDDLHRRVATMPVRGGSTGVKTTNTLDAAGQALATKRLGAGDTLSAAVTLEQFQYDVLGRVIRMTNALGGATTNLYLLWGTSGGRRDVTLLPDGGTRTNDYQLDGRLMKVTGTAVKPVQFEYGIAPGTSQIATQYVKEIKLDSSWNTTTEWTKTYRDGLDREICAVYADVNTPAEESDNPYSETAYNAQGQLSKKRDPDGVATIHKYNGQGELESSGLDLNWSGDLEDSSPDRITRTARSFPAAADDKPDRVQTDTYSWADNGQGGYVEKLIARTETATDGLHTWQTAWREAGNDTTKAATENITTVNSATHQRTVTVIAPDGTQTVSVYLYGLLQSVTRKDNTAGHRQVTQTTYGYDKYDRPSTVTDARNGATTLLRNNADQVCTNIAPLSGGLPMVTVTFFDQLGRVTGTIQPDGASTTNFFFPGGLPQRTSGSRTYPVEYTYDAQGRLRTQKTWQDFANDSGVALTRWNYDPHRGWLASKDYCDPATGSLASEGSTGPIYSNSPAGRLRTRTWKRLGNNSQPIVTTYSYGFDGTAKHGDLTGITYSANDPAGTPNVSFDYDRLGRRKTAATTSGGTTLDSIAYSFDDANQPLGESHSGTLLDGLGVSVTMNNALQRQNLSLTGVAGYSVGYGYDSAGRLQTVTSGNATMTYSYVANSMLVEQISSVQAATSVMTTKNYDLLNRLTSVSSAVSGTAAPTLPISFAYQYNQAGQRTRVTVADGSFWVYTYDSLGQVTSGRRSWADGTLVSGQQFGYSFDTIGNRLSTTVGGSRTGDPLRPANYTRDLLNRLNARDVPAYADILGLANPTAPVLVNSNTAYRKGEYFHHVLSVPNSSTPQYPEVTVVSSYPPGQTNKGGIFVPQIPEYFGYDADGNLTTDGRWNYTWDAENRLIRMATNTSVGPQISLSFEYDSQSRRIRKQVWFNGAATNDLRFVYDGWNLTATLNSQLSTLSSFVWGTDLSSSFQGAGGVGGLLKVAYHGTQTTNCFVAFDGNGNVSALIDAADGNALTRYGYGPFGEPIRVTGLMARATPFRFSTKYQDDETGLLYYGYRYYSVSTGRWVSRDPLEESGGRNLHCFVGNSPTTSTDSSGLCAGPCASVEGPRYASIVPPLPYPPLPSSCEDLAKIIKSFLHSPEENLFFDLFTDGGGRPLVLGLGGMQSALANAIGFQSAISGQRQLCATSDDGWSYRSTTFPDFVGGPWRLALGQVTVYLNTHCKCHKLTWEVCVKDRYDFDPHAPGQRGPEAELMTRLMYYANALCPQWTPFDVSGCARGAGGQVTGGGPGGTFE